MKDFQDKVALITGGSSGIGAAVALCFAQEGASVAISYRENRSGGDKVTEEIAKFGGNILTHRADLSIESEAKKLVEAAQKRFGKIDILINNAGGYIDGDEWNGSGATWQKTLGQNLLSAMNVAKYVVPIFQEQRSGVMVNIASRHGLSGQIDALAYAAAKAGVINITQAYAKLLAPYGRANSISPGTVETGYWLTAPQDELQRSLDETPLKQMAQTSDIAEAALYLAGERSRMITGQNLLIDGGYLLK